jgi:peptide deformylase
VNISGNIIGMFNPTMTITQPSKLVESHEISLLCEDQTEFGQLRFNRHQKVLVYYTNEHKEPGFTLLSDHLAFSLQHMLDILEGQWMCPDRGRQHNIPAVNKHEHNSTITQTWYPDQERARAKPDL